MSELHPEHVAARVAEQVVGPERWAAFLRERREARDRAELAAAGVRDGMTPEERALALLRHTRERLGLPAVECEDDRTAAAVLAATQRIEWRDPERGNLLRLLLGARVQRHVPRRHAPWEPAEWSVPPPPGPERDPEDDVIPASIAERLKPITAANAVPDSEGRFPPLPMSEIAKLFELGKLPRPRYRPPQF